MRVSLLSYCCLLLLTTGFKDHGMKAAKHTEALDVGRGQTEIREKLIWWWQQLLSIYWAARKRAFSEWCCPSNSRKRKGADVTAI